MTSRTLRTALAAVALTVPAAFSAPATAHNLGEVGVAVGTGTISPGLSADCERQEVTFGGQVVGAGLHAGVYTVTFLGHSTDCGTTTQDSGTGTLSGDFSGTVAYNRVGNVVTLTGTGALGTAQHHIEAAVCEFVPLDTAPTKTFALACEVVLGEG